MKSNSHPVYCTIKDSCSSSGACECLRRKGGEYKECHSDSALDRARTRIKLNDLKGILN